jgi:hypothetical protein
MKKKKYHTLGTVSIFIRNILERGNIDTHKTQMHFLGWYRHFICYIMEASDMVEIPWESHWICCKLLIKLYKVHVSYLTTIDNQA